MRVLLRWILFACYTAFLFCLPFAVLWEGGGLLLGLGLSAAFLFLLGYRGTDRIADRLEVVPLSRAEAPILYSIVEEYCRRLSIPLPRLGVIESPALNLATFGFSRRNAYLVFTRGAIKGLSRAQLSAVICRSLCTVWYRDVLCDSWLSQCLIFLDRLASDQGNQGHRSHLRRFYPLRLFLRQVVLYPIALIPLYVLKRSVDPTELDLRAAQLSRHPREFAEALRHIEAVRERLPLRVPLSTRHLFLATPSSFDPMVRVFFQDATAPQRIQALENLSRISVPV